MTYGFTVSSLDPVFVETVEDLLTAAEEAELAFWIEAGVLAEETLATSADLPFAQRDELEELAHIGKLATRRMIAANTGLVRLFATGRPFSPLSYDDRFAEGMHGLERAVRKFDFTRGLKFSTYAARWIKNFVQRAEHAATPMPVALREQRRHIVRATDEFVAAHGRQPSPTELATAVGLSVSRIGQIERDYANATRHLSLDQSLDRTASRGRSDTLHSVVAAPASTTGHMPYIDETVAEAISSLAGRYQQVLSDHFGLDGRQPRTVDEIAVARGLRPDRVQAVLDDALAALRRHLTAPDRDLDDVA